MNLQDKLEKSLRMALAREDMSQKSLAAKMECTGAYISKVMSNGKLSVSKLNDIAEALGFTLWEFIKLGEEQ